MGGIEAQIDLAIEKMAELTQKLIHYRRNRCTQKDVCEEIADVELMCRQMSMIFDSPDNNFVNRIRAEKVDRLKGRLESRDYKTTC